MRILILSAFAEEAAQFKEALPESKEVVIGRRKCFMANTEEHQIFISYTGIGTTSAASTTTALCERLDPDCILMCGSAGGLTAGQITGDIVIGETVVDIDLHTLPTALTGTPFEPCLTDPHLAKPIDLEFHPHPLFLEICAASGLDRVARGKIVTSNTFPAPPDAFRTIQELGCDAIEMESTGVFNAAKHYDIPVMAVRAVSNSLDADGKDLGTPEGGLAICSGRIRDFLHDLFPRIHDLYPLVAEKSERITAQIAAQHGLNRHPEGGYYKQTHRSCDHVHAVGEAEARYAGELRLAGTSILFLLGKTDFSAWHSVASDETWNFHDGAPLKLRVIDAKTNEMREIKLGCTPRATPQLTIRAGDIFSAETEGTYTLVGCSVTPGFEFQDFKLISRAEITARLAGQKDKTVLALRLTRDKPVESANAAKEGFVPTRSGVAGIGGASHEAMAAQKVQSKKLLPCAKQYF